MYLDILNQKIFIAGVISHRNIGIKMYYENTANADFILQ